MKFDVKLELHTQTPEGKAAIVWHKERIEALEIGASDAPVAFRTEGVGDMNFRGEEIDQRLARLTRDGWIAPVSSNGIGMTATSLPEMSGMLSRLADVRNALPLRPGGPILHPRTSRHYPGTAVQIETSRRACPDWARKQAEGRGDLLRGQVVVVDGNVHVRVGEPVIVVGSRNHYMEQLCARFADTLPLSPFLALFRADAMAEAEELLRAGYSRKPEHGQGWRIPRVEVEADALRRIDDDLAPRELATSAALAFKSLYRGGFLPAAVLSAAVPILRLSEADRELGADELREPIDTFMKEIAKVPRIAFKGKAETPAQYASQEASHAKSRMGFIRHALSRLNVEFKPTEDDAAALEGLAF